MWGMELCQNRPVCQNIFVPVPSTWKTSIFDTPAFVNEIILCKSCFAVTFEVTDIYIEPDGFGKVKGLANFCNSLKYFGCSGFFGIVADDQIIGHTIVKKCFSP